MAPPFNELLNASAAQHRHLCPRQVLGVRMGILAGEILGLALPRTDKRLLMIVETDGCVVDGLSAATQCTAGRRTLRVEDYGKVAATFIDTRTGQAVRIAPRREARLWAAAYAPKARNKWEAMLLGYQRMPAATLLTVQKVMLKTPLERESSRAGRKIICDVCGEEISNGREVRQARMTLCRACSGEAYYFPLPETSHHPPSALVRPC
jgi:formylmethanofuran dehydrogenase subunit E